MATALTLMVLAAVVQVFGTVSESISDARSFVEKVDQLRITQRQLKQDLEGVTAYMTPPLAPEQNLGYLEYVEGPLGPVLPLGDPVNTQAVNIDHPVTTGYEMDSTQGDTDDVLMFTTRSRTLPFVGRINGAAANSQLAEVAWFVRGRTLYRRVLLIAPQTNVSTAAWAGFYNYYDLSARYDPVQGKMVANTLADLTRPENRFAHTNGFTTAVGGPYYVYPPHPYNVLTWLTGPNYSISWLTGAATSSTWLTGLKLPTLCESSCAAWDLSKPLPTPATTPALTLTPTSVFDAWRSPYAFSQLDPSTGNLNNASGYYNGARVSEDVILTNVIGFDVKAWDPGAPVIINNTQTDSATHLPNGPVVTPGDPGYTTLLASANCQVVSLGAYVDLNYLYPYRKAVGGPGAYYSTFSGPGSGQSGLMGSDPTNDTGSSNVKPLCSVYDTWCTRFENYNGFGDKSHDGFDDGATSTGIVDGVNKTVIFPPYPAKLAGIQVKIRVYEPDSRQVREVTVTQSFLNE